MNCERTLDQVEDRAPAGSALWSDDRTRKVSSLIEVVVRVNQCHSVPVASINGIVRTNGLDGLEDFHMRRLTILA